MYNMTKAKNEIVENIREVKKKYNLSSLEIIKIINDEANHHIVNYMGKRVETAETVNITKEDFKEIKKEEAINYYFLEDGEMFAFSNDHTELFSYIEDFAKEDQECFSGFKRYKGFSGFKVESELGVRRI